MSSILCIIDGMTDPYFRAADYPNLSAMELLRYVDTTCGQEPESLGCILRLLGIRDIPAHLRGYAETLGYGVPVEKTDLILRGSWFSLDARGCCDRPVAAPGSLPEIEGCHYHQLEQYKSLLVFPGMAGAVSDIVTRPPYGCAAQSAGDLCPTGCEVVSRVFRSQLTKDRCLIPWGQSVPGEMEPFPHRAAVICGAPIVKGIARLLAMDVMWVSDATGDTDTALGGKAEAARRAADTYPFVLLHINGADEASHRRDPEEKRDFLHKVDAVVLKELLRSEHTVYVASDHGTDPVTGEHVGDRQPVFVGGAVRSGK